MSKYLSREEILQAQDIETKEVAVPEWGGIVLVKGLNGAERNAYESMIMDAETQEMTIDKAMEKLISMSIVDENGNRVFTDTDIEALSKKSASALMKVFTAARKLNGLEESDIAEMVKNSETVPSDGSTLA